MLFSNRSFKSEIREMSFGTLEGISLGEKGRGRMEYFCPTPAKFAVDQFETIPASVGLTKSGKARINDGDDGKMYLVLSARRCYTRGCYGRIEAPKGQAIRKMAYAYGAFGDAGRTGNWDECIVQAKPGDWFRKSGCSDKGQQNWYFFVQDEKTVLHCPADQVGDLIDALDLTPPFSLEYNRAEWETIR